MGKEKKGKNISLPQKNVHLRLAFLHQAASHLADRVQDAMQEHSGTVGDGTPVRQAITASKSSQPRYLVNQMKGVSRKSVIRIHRDTKRSVCKRCDEVLIEGSTVIEEIENKSTYHSKPWADINVVRCTTCGLSKRFPLNARRPEKTTTSTSKTPAEISPSC